MFEREVLWTDARIHIPKGVIRNGRLRMREGRIDAVGGPELQAASANARVCSLRGFSILPGFIDVHTHGGNGYDAMTGTFESLDKISQYHAMHGTTSFLATTETAPLDRIVKVLEHAADAVRRQLSGAEIVGIHLEGPYINEKRRGAQSRDDIRLPLPEEIDMLMDMSKRCIRLVTLAPEVGGGMAAVRRFAGYGVTVSIGHSDASFAEVEEAVRAGAKHTTHHYNGMSPFHHREPGVAGAGLILPELTTEIIADGIHVHPAAVRHLFAGKTPRNVCMITDSIACAGLPDGEYGNVVKQGGQIYLSDMSSLAGSSLTMIQALRNVIRFTGLSVEEILPSMTQVPARQIGISHRKGSLEAGKDADFVIVDDNLNIRATFVQGREVYRSDDWRSTCGEASEQ